MILLQAIARLPDDIKARVRAALEKSIDLLNVLHFCMQVDGCNTVDEQVAYLTREYKHE